jgi:TRAP transporter TAXI family solute receptor
MTNSKTRDQGSNGLSRRQVLAAGGAVIGASALSSLPLADALAADRILQLGSASLGSTGYVIVETLSAIINKYSDPKLRTSSMSTAGGAENMALLGEGFIDFGQTTSADWHPALNGLKPYKKPVKAYQMFSYMVWTPVPIVRADSGIKSIADFAGKRISTGSSGGSATRLWKALLDAAGVLDKVEFVATGGWRGTYDAFRQNSIDITSAILTTGKPSPLVNELESSVKLNVIDVPADLLEAARKKNPGVLTYDLTPDKWKTVTKPMPVPAYAGILAAHPRIDADTAYNMTKTIYEGITKAKKVPKLLENVHLDFATKYLMRDIPVHPGAAKFFKEKGAWRDDLTIAKL